MAEVGSPEGAMIVRGAIHTMDPQAPVVEAMGVSGGRIVGTGSVEDVRRAVGRDGPVLDLEGMTVLPGLVDSHNHMLSTGLGGQMLSLAPARSIGELLQRVEAWATEHPEAPWITSAEGWELDDLAERRYPNRDELDAISIDRPIYLPRVGHGGAVNSRALELAGIDAGTPDPPGGIIERDATGQPTGALLENARHPVDAVVPPPSDAQRRAALEEVQRRYLASGITAVQEPGLLPAEMACYQAVQEAGDLHVRVTMMPLVSDGPGLADRLAALGGSGVRTGFGNESLRLGGLKVYLDGGGSMGTALLRRAWPECGDYHGELLTARDSLSEITEFCARHGWSLGVHAVGGGAIDLVLEVLGEVHRSVPLDHLRCSLLHAYLTPTAENMAQARDLGVVLAAQPTMLERFAAVLTRRLGRDEVTTAMPLRSWLEAGVRVAGGSDSPVTPYQPFRGIWQAVARFSADLDEVLGPDQCLTREQALRMYTTDAAWASFAEAHVGRLAAGMQADWIALEADPLSCPVDELADLVPSVTAVGGRLVHDARG